MSEGNAKVDTMNKCYQCEEELGFDPKDDVHPLCVNCDNEFEDWLIHEMGMFA